MVQRGGLVHPPNIEEVLGFVGLFIKDIMDKNPNEFSGGQVQRISIARALLPEPRLILADEPVSMINASLRMNILNMFKELKKQQNISII